MHDNISQISRWWIAKSILLQHVDQSLFRIQYEQPTSSLPPSWNRSSNPAHLATLTHPQKVHQMNNFIADTIPISEYKNAVSTSLPIVPSEAHKTLSYYDPHTVSPSKEMQENMSINPPEPDPHRKN
jgi:hypothetical protein